jgi:hypothetical protein
MDAETKAQFMQSLGAMTAEEKAQFIAATVGEDCVAPSGSSAVGIVLSVLQELLSVILSVL